MEESMKKRVAGIVGLVLALVAWGGIARGVTLGSAITYQGRLDQDGAPATGNFDLLFRLYDQASNGTQIGPDQILLSTPVAEGLFTVQLDFGAASYNGDARWLDIRVKPAGDPTYTVLTPRQPVTASPYALRAISGGTGGSQWVSDGPDLTYSTGGVGVTGGSSPFASG
jgi:hypothetical protein